MKLDTLSYILGTEDTIEAAEDILQSRVKVTGID